MSMAGRRPAGRSSPPELPCPELPAFAHHFAIFGQQAAQAIPLHGAELDLLLPNPVQGQCRLLGLGLNRHRFARHLRGHPDGASVTSVIFAANAERHHLLPCRPDRDRDLQSAQETRLA